MAASGALASLSQDNPATLEEFLPVVIQELRRETESGVTDEAPEIRAKKRAVRANLIETVSHLIITASETTVEREGFVDFVGAVDTELDDKALRVTTQALFTSANERSRELAAITELLDELLMYPDVVVQAWTAGTVGGIAASHPNAIAATALNLRQFLTHEDSAVKHNTIEALAAFVGPRPDVVVPTIEMLRDLLNHEEVSIQQNAAGVLYMLAKPRPDAVIPALEELQHLRTHDDEAVRQTASATFAQLAQERPAVVTNSELEQP